MTTISDAAALHFFIVGGPANPGALQELDALPERDVSNRLANEVAAAHHYALLGGRTAFNPDEDYYDPLAYLLPNVPMAVWSPKEQMSWGLASSQTSKLRQWTEPPATASRSEFEMTNAWPEAPQSKLSHWLS